jgi:putative Mg2+ transporter-C (MgtC) family protein
MSTQYAAIAAHLALALAAGGAIGLERTFHGRPAGFRTHALVCLASALLMQFTIYQWKLLPGVPIETLRSDPTRLAQGIMTGIGFLGAGVIFKEGLTVRGLTTAASIWITAAIGILTGIGFYYPAALATVLTLATLSVFRWIEVRMPVQTYAEHRIRFARNDVMTEEQLRALLKDHGFSVATMTYEVTEDGSLFEYRMTIQTAKAADIGKLADALRRLDRVRGFQISPVGP